MICFLSLVSTIYLINQGTGPLVLLRILICDRRIIKLECLPMARQTIRLLRRHFKALTSSAALCLLEIFVMGFGLCYAPTTFKGLMTRVLDPFLHLFVIVYMNGICIYSKSREEHLNYLWKVLKTLGENKLYIKMFKCFEAKRETEYLGLSLKVALL